MRNERSQMNKIWLCDPPVDCNICHTQPLTTFVDGGTQMGPWAIMCPKCHKMFGLGLGTGKGQEYTQQPDQTWLKTKG